MKITCKDGKVFSSTSYRPMSRLRCSNSARYRRAPYLGYRLALERYDLKASLTNLTPKRLLILAVAYSVANPLLHHIWFALQGNTQNVGESFLMMFAGDLTGALIMLYIIKGILAFLPTQRSRSRMTGGMLMIRLALDRAYNNQLR